MLFRPVRTLFTKVNQQGRLQTYLLSKTINQPAKCMYDAVAKVDLYKEFIPYCKNSFVNTTDTNGYPTEAGLRIGFQKYDEEFTCAVKCDNTSVTADSLTHTLFEHLETVWTIKPNEEIPHRTDVELRLIMQFKSPLYTAVSGLFAKSAMELAFKAFEKRAYTLKRAKL